MIWHRLPYLAALFAPAPPNDPKAARCARRWSAAADRDPELAEDLIRLSGLLVTQPVDPASGTALPLDATRLAYEAGRRDFALQLLAMMQLSPSDLDRLMRDPDDRRHHHHDNDD